MLRRLARLGSLDIRWLYFALLLSIVLSAFIPVAVKIQLSPEAQKFYDSIERLDGSRPVLLHSDWDQGTIGELRAQFRNIVRHLFRKNVRFVIISGIATGSRFYTPEVQLIAEEFGKTYGRDWIAVGYKLADPKGITVEALSKDFSKVAPLDDRGRPPSEYPWLRNVKTADDWDLVISVGYAEYREYITYFYETARTPYLCGIAAITSTALYPFISTGTIRGMLVGSRGGGEYEQAMGRPNDFGSRLLLGQSAGHLLLLAGIILGNIGQLAARALEARTR